MNITTESLSSKKVPELQKMLKAEGIPYKVYSKLKKQEMITRLIPPAQDQVEPEEPVESQPEITDPHLVIKTATEEFLARGGKIQQLPSPRDPKKIPANEKTALTTYKSEKKTKKVKKAKKKNEKSLDNSGNKKSVVRDSKDLVTLKDFISKYSVTGVQVRKALRSSEIEKPGKQWAWDSKDPALKELAKLISELESSCK